MATILWQGTLVTVGGGVVNYQDIGQQINGERDDVECVLVALDTAPEEAVEQVQEALAYDGSPRTRALDVGGGPVWPSPPTPEPQRELPEGAAGVYRSMESILETSGWDEAAGRVKGADGVPYAEQSQTNLLLVQMIKAMAHAIDEEIAAQGNAMREARAEINELHAMSHFHGDHPSVGWHPVVPADGPTVNDFDVDPAPMPRPGSGPLDDDPAGDPLF